MEVDNVHFPQTKFLSFKQTPKFEAMTSKLKEFNAQVPEGDRLQDDQLEKMHLLCMEDKDSSTDDVVCLMKALRWPQNMSFPALDILRCAVLNPKTNKFLLNDTTIDDVISLMMSGLDAGSPDNCKMLTLRILANMFLNDRGNFRFLLL